MNINRKLKIFKCAFSSGATPFASIFITRRCNRSCDFCNARHDSGKELSTGEWKKAIDILYEMGVRNLSINGGEALLREDVGEIIDYASNVKGCITWLFTNGTTLSDQNLRSLKGLDFLCASLNGLADDKPETFIRFLQELKRCEKYNISPAFLAVITAENLDRIHDMARESVANNVLFDFGILQNVGGRFSAKEGGLKPEADKLKPLFKKLAQLRAKTGKVLPSYHLLKKAAEFYKRNNWKCPSKKNPFIVVDTDGHLMPCQEFRTDLSIFDVPKLTDERWIKAKRKIVDACKGCAWTCYYQKTFRNPFDLLQESVVLLKF